MTIDPQLFGQTMQKVDDLIPLVREHIRASDLRHDDSEARIQGLEEDRRFLKRLLVVLGILWPLVIPVLQRFVLNILGVDAGQIADLLTFIQPIVL